MRSNGLRCPISIHALREEGDLLTFFFSRIRKISIHALREEGDFGVTSNARKPFLFLSTPSARRATPRHRAHFAMLFISIHALREEGDNPLNHSIIGWG